MVAVDIVSLLTIVLLINVSFMFYLINRDFNDYKYDPASVFINNEVVALEVIYKLSFLIFFLPKIQPVVKKINGSSILKRRKLKNVLLIILLE